MHLKPGRIPTINEIIKGLSIMCEARERPGMAIPVLPGVGEDGLRLHLYLYIAWRNGYELFT